MKLNRKWILVIALVMSVAMATGGTLAYLTSTETVDNTFTVGSVKIDLVEEEFDKLQKPPVLLPGTVIPKDPLIKNIGTTEAWVWMKITMPTALYKLLDINWDTTGEWTQEVTAGDPDTVITMKRGQKLAAGAETVEAFTQISLPTTLKDKEMAALGSDPLNIRVTAFAIQDSNFGTVDVAMNNFDGDDGTSAPVAKVTTLGADDTLTNVDGDVVVLDKNLVIDTTNSKMGIDLGKVNLDVAYQFEPTMTYEEGDKSEYADWHADFVVKANKDIPANAIGLAGYYDAWCSFNDDKWVLLTADSIIPANEEIRLVDAMGNGSITVSYRELCNYGNDGIGFLCGAVALEGKEINGTMVEALPEGTTLSVELRLYEATGGSSTTETGEYITTGTYTYTF